MIYGIAFLYLWNIENRPLC